MSEPLRRTRRIPGLDGLRGLAVCLVFVHHVGGQGVQKVLPEFQLGKAFWYNSWCFIEMFLLVSGFLATGRLLETRRSPGSLRRFLTGRVLRVLPLYFALLLLAFVLLRPLLAGRSDYDSAWRQQWTFWMLVQNWMIGLQGWWQWEYVNHLWYVAVDAQFFLVWALVIALVPHRALLGVTLLGCLVAPACRVALHLLQTPPLACYMWTPCRIDSLMLGSVLALLVRSEQGIALLRAIRPWAAGASAAALAVWIALTGRLVPTSFSFCAFGYTLVAVFFGSLLSYCVLPGRPNWFVRLVDAPSLGSVGRLSYGIYLFHFPIIVYLVRYFPKFSGFWGQLLSAAIFTLWVASLSLVLAYASWRLFEKPLLSLKRRWGAIPQEGEEATMPSGGSDSSGAP